jgi:hypothetical protein
MRASGRWSGRPSDYPSIELRQRGLVFGPGVKTCTTPISANVSIKITQLRSDDKSKVKVYAWGSMAARSAGVGQTQWSMYTGSRTKSRAASCSTSGTATSTISSSRNSRHNNSASWASV